MSTSFDITKVIMCPSKPDLSKDVYGSDFTAEALFYLRMRDAKSKFAIDTLVNDAWRNGFQFASSADEKACAKRKNWQGETPLRVLKKNTGVF